MKIYVFKLVNWNLQYYLIQHSTIVCLLLGTYYLTRNQTLEFVDKIGHYRQSTQVTHSFRWTKNYKFSYRTTMKLALILLSAFLSLAVAIDGSFETPLDHFRNQDGRTARFVSLCTKKAQNKKLCKEINSYVALRHQCWPLRRKRHFIILCKRCRAIHHWMDRERFNRWFSYGIRCCFIYNWSSLL